MIRLLIDGVECPLADERIELPKYNARSMSTVDGWREGQRVDVEVEATPLVERLFEHASDLYRCGSFNDSYHIGQIEAEGVVVFEGVVMLIGVKRDVDRRVYRIALRCGGAEWAEVASQTLLEESDIEAERRMTIADIEASWSDDSAVRMLPLFHDSYPEPAPVGLYLPHQELMPHDYHPFISVKAVIESMARKSGYTLVSKFFDSELGRRLVFSGAYRSVDVNAASQAMGFKAMRAKSNTASAGSDGRVYAWEPVGVSNVGALVDTVSPNAIAEDGTPLAEAFSNGGCFTFEGRRPLFTPRREIGVSFNIHLCYSTDYKMVSSKQLKGFNNIHLGNGCDVVVELPNPYTDMRNDVRSGLVYKLMIFDYDPSLEYMLGGYGEVEGSESNIQFEEGYSGSTELYVRRSAESPYGQFTGDWALYEGAVSTVGRRDVEIDVRTPFEQLTPTRPKRFNDIYFGGAEPGQSFTLKAGCSITPIFGGVAGYGDYITFKDVANHNMSQAKLLSAVAHMFNLRVYTHRPSKRLYIEPYDGMYRSDIYDWRSRQLDDWLLSEESVVESFATTRLSYRDAEGATARISSIEGGDLGVWTHSIDSYAVKYAVDNRVNEVFLPTASFRALVGEAPSAEILTVGDRDAIAYDDYVKPRIALYYGVVELDSDQRWPSTSGNSSYPLVSFHCPKMGDTLCFEDRDGCQGLHRYYDTELKELSTKQRVTCRLRVMPHEYVDLFDPESEGASILSLFRLNIDGESSLFRLWAIDEYDMATNRATCVFQRITTD